MLFPSLTLSPSFVSSLLLTDSKQEELRTTLFQCIEYERLKTHVLFYLSLSVRGCHSFSLLELSKPILIIGKRSQASANIRIIILYYLMTPLLEPREEFGSGKEMIEINANLIEEWIDQRESCKWKSILRNNVFVRCSRNIETSDERARGRGKGYRSFSLLGKQFACANRMLLFIIEHNRRG